MIVIPLAPEFIELVRQRKKSSTIRVGIRKYSEGPAVFAAGLDRLPINITKVEHTTLDRLTDLDSCTDGFESRSELLTALRRFYPTIKPTEDVTIVRFLPR